LRLFEGAQVSIEETQYYSKGLNMESAGSFVRGPPAVLESVVAVLNGRRLLARGRDRRIGRRHRQIIRLLIAAADAPVTTRQMVEFVYPWLDPSKPIARWRWRKVRLSAERYAERVTPRTRPLRWRTK
jgi:hypothetical protein